MTAERRMDLAADDPRARFSTAWQEVIRARAVCRALAEAWNAACPGAFHARISTDWDGAGEIWVELDFDQATRQRLNQLAQDVGTSLRRALDAGLVAAAGLVSGVICEPDPQLVRFPIADTLEEFLTAYANGALDGVRPDHVQFVEMFQPFLDEPDELPAEGHPLRFVRQLTELRHGNDAVVAWCHLAQPEAIIAPPSSIVDLTADPDGPVNLSRRVATFTVTYPDDLPPFDRPAVYGNPNAAFDLMAAVGPEAAEFDDTFGRRAAAATHMVQRILAAFERSLGLRDGSSVAAWNPASRLVDSNDRPNPGFGEMSGLEPRGGEARTAVGESDIGIAAVRDGPELTLAVAAENSIYLRRVSAATALDPRLPQGTAAEEAAATAASIRGLPDFVFPPVTRKTGSGVREIGDGIVFLTDHGLILQVKSRNNVTTHVDRETNWVIKKIGEAARQAVGTLTQLRRQPAVLTNQRGRQITIDGNAVRWVAVVLIDHADPPEGIIPITDHKSLPVVTLLRRDWEFLFEQLGSTAAVVHYVHRVAGDALELGEEPVYYDLASKDLTAEPTPPRNDWSRESGGAWQPRPLLPQQPTSLSGSGHAMFRMLLEDLAAARAGGSEEHRLAQLAILDNTPVVDQANIGTRLLDLLQQVKQVRLGHGSWNFRWLIDTQRPQQVCFGVSNQYSNMHREIFKSRLLLQHHRMTRHEWDPADEPTTTGVLLTPNYSLVDRLWDTTTLTIIGDAALTLADAQALAEGWQIRRL